MTALSDDINAIPPEQIGTVHAEHTIAGRRIVFNRP
jgi:predicted amidohydrolase YtcJ